MLFGIVVGIITLVAIVVGIVVFYTWKSRQGPKVKSHHVGHDSVKSINNVGVMSKEGRGAGAGGRMMSAPTTAAPETTSGRPSEIVRPRFVAVGVLAAAVFGSLTAKLWSMQVLAASEYENEAIKNKYATIATPAPRGLVFDADGVQLVKNRTALTVLADASVANDHDVVQRLSTVLGIPFNIVKSRIQDTSSGAQSQRVVSSDARQRDVAFIAEHSDAFSGVTVQERTVRDYPYGALASHVLGYTGTVSDDELQTVPENRQIELGDTVGKSGIEAFYDGLLAGDHGQRRVVVDSQGRVVEVESETAATRGNDIYLTIKAPVQYVAEQELAGLIAPTGIIGKGKGVGGAVVAMDVTDGSILALASYPTFDPSKFTGGISQDIWDLYSTAESYYPLLNRAVSGTYPAASTYKAYTGLAGLKYGFATADKMFNCAGSWDGFHTGDVQNCWNLNGHGPIDLHWGIRVSCDVVFYEIAKQFYDAGKSQGGSISDTALQEEIAMFGFGRETGIDLLGEEAGRIPTPEWKAQHWSDVPTEAQWYGGDLTNLVIGQGDCLITPLQNAVGYGAVATGMLMKPHLLKEARNSLGEPVIKVESEVTNKPDVSEDNYKYVREALKLIASDTDKVVAALEDYGIDATTVSSKTGTGEVAGKGDVAWYVCFYPQDKPKYVVSTCIEQGGGGGDVAGPVGAHVLGAILANEKGELNEVGRVAGSNGKSVELKTGSASRED
ncbi:MAG: penicillin-binding protein 2 [Coriobacteriaceae bacterium]|jgi:penicillin-binding protein 2|nr:penicillin-binding protein 2 [Coriobacteriaceae bacterium]